MPSIQYLVPDWETGRSIVESGRQKNVREKVEMLVEQMAERWGVTEELKMRDQMEWVRRMNNIKATAEEIAYKNIIFM